MHDEEIYFLNIQPYVIWDNYTRIRRG